jgi:hypothetical protein
MMPVMEEASAGLDDDVARRRARRVAVWAGLGFALLQLAWMLLMPPATGIDELDHVYRANSVASGHWGPGRETLPRTMGRGQLIPVRSDLVDASAPSCARLTYTAPFNCRPYRQLSGDMVEVASGAGAYNPTFYAVVGTLARPLTGNAAIYGMRVVAGLLCTVAFALATFLTVRWSRTRWPLAALLLAALPTTVYSTIVVAPNGLHIMSGLLVWSAVAALLRGAPTSRFPAYAALVLGAAVLANTHTLGLLWVGLIGMTVAAFVGLRTSVAIIRPRTGAEWGALLVSAAALVFALWWLWYGHPNTTGESPGEVPGSRWGNIALGVPLWLFQAIAAFPLRNEPAPILCYAVAFVVLVSMSVATIRSLRGQRALARALLLLVVLSVAVPVALTYQSYETLGLAWQGRYGMPYTVGFFVLAAMALDRGLPSPRLPILVVGVGTWVFGHVIGELSVLAEQSSDHHLVAATGWWAPPPAAIVALGVVAAAAWVTSVRLAEPQVHRSGEPDPSRVPVRAG